MTKGGFPILAGAGGTVAQAGPMSPDWLRAQPAFILTPDGKFPRGIADLIDMPALKPCTLDFWAHGKHRRAFGVTFVRNGDRITMQSEEDVLIRKGKTWEKDKIASFDHLFLTGEGYCVPTHNDEGLLFYTAAHKLSHGKAVQFALYPARHTPGPGVIQVTHWLNRNSPAIGTPDW